MTKEKLKELKKKLKELKYDEQELKYEYIWSYGWFFVDSVITLGLMGLFIYSIGKRSAKIK